MIENNDKPVDELSKKITDTPQKETTNNKPSQHKHAKLVLVIVFIVLLGIIAALSYLLLQEDKTISDNQDDSVTEMIGSEIPDEKIDESVGNSRPEIPDGFILYEDLINGFSFYYPEVWGEIEESPTSNLTIYNARFTNNDRAQIYLNSGDQDFTSGGRGGALWDCVGHTYMGNKDIGCKAVYIDESGKRLSGSVLENASSYATIEDDDFIVSNKYEYFETDVAEILFNPNSTRYYGGTLVIQEPTDEDLDNLDKMLFLFSTKVAEGL